MNKEAEEKPELVKELILKLEQIKNILPTKEEIKTKYDKAIYQYFGNNSFIVTSLIEGMQYLEEALDKLNSK